MKNLLLLILAALATCPAITYAQTNPDADPALSTTQADTLVPQTTRQILQQQLDALTSAVLRQDVRVVKRMLAPDFTFRFESGKTLSRQQYLNGITEASEREHDLSIEINLQTLKVHKKGATGFATILTRGTILDSTLKPVTMETDDYAVFRWRRDGNYDHIIQSVHRLNGVTRINGNLVTPTVPSPISRPQLTSIRNTRWQLVEIAYNNDTFVRPFKGEKLTLGFDNAGKVMGSAGINRFNGSYTVGGNNSLAFGQLAMTRAMNPPGSSADKYIRDLRSATRYMFNNGMLMLQLPLDSGVMKFRRIAD